MTILKVLFCKNHTYTLQSNEKRSFLEMKQKSQKQRNWKKKRSKHRYDGKKAPGSFHGVAKSVRHNFRLLKTCFYYQKVRASWQNLQKP